MNIKTLSLIALSASLAASASAVTFGNISVSGTNYSAGPNTLVTGNSVLTAGNSITFTTPNAIVGVAAPSAIQVGFVTFQYDADASTGLFGTSIGWKVDALETLSQTFLKGTGELTFQEDVFEITGIGGSELTQIGTFSKTWNASSSATVWSGSLPLTKSVKAIRVKKTFTLEAVNNGISPADFAGLAKTNQSLNVVPEPASMAALGMGALALIRRRRKKSA